MATFGRHTVILDSLPAAISDPLSLLEDMALDAKRERSQGHAERKQRQFDARIKTDALPLDRFFGRLPE